MDDFKFADAREITAECLQQCIYEGLQYEVTFHNIVTARKYYAAARSMMEQKYGKGHRLCGYISQYDYSEELQKGNHREAMLKLADAGNLLYDFGKADIIDDITEWIFENREERLREVVAKTWMVYHNFDVAFSMEQMVFQLVIGSNNVESTLNRLLFDPVGLPHCFRYLIADMNQSLGSEELQNMLPILGEMLEIEQKASAAKTDRERAEVVMRMHSCMKKLQAAAEAGGGFSAFLAAMMNQIDFISVLGLYNIKDYKDGDQIWEEMSLQADDAEDIADRIRIMEIECIQAMRNGKYGEANDLFGQILEEEENMAIQAFSLKRETEKLEYLEAVGSILKGILNISLAIAGTEASYELLLRRRTLTMDYACNRLNGSEGMKIASEYMRLEKEKRSGKDVTIQQEQVREWFNEAAGDIFSCRAEDVRSRLTERQALLEFTVIEDEAAQEHYFVFVVLKDRILSVTFEKCSEIDPYFERVFQFMERYSANRFSTLNLRQLWEYRQIYEKLLMPLGEVLPAAVRELLIVPEGKMGKIPFEVLPSFQWYDEYMGDEYEIIYLNTGRELLIDTVPSSERGSLVIGAPDFSPDQNYSELPAAKYEAERIAALLGTAPYVGKRATKDVLKKPAQIIHISTHSYRLKEGDEEGIKDPMKRTGLVFAGGELLSARQIGGLDLHQTDLAVLSVCNDGNGEVIYKEPGMGLRRAFMNAGVRHLIMNLWKADDSAGSLFMECFYHSYIIEKRSLPYSLKRARIYLRERTAEEIKAGPYCSEYMKAVLSEYEDSDKPYRHPYYWSGYVQIGL